MLRIVMLAGIILLLSCPASARVWVLHADGSGDAPTIGAAIDSADGGDIIELTDGVYTGPGNRDLYAGEMWYLVRSQSGNPEACIIDVEGSAGEHHRAFTFSADG